MRTRSVCGLTITVTVVVPARVLAALVAVTWKVRGVGAVSSGMIGAVKVCAEPSSDAGVNNTAGPPVCVHVKLSVPPAGSTAVAVNVTAAPLATGFAGDELVVTTGGALAGGTTIGTITVAGAEAGTNPSPPTINWKLRFCGPTTVGAMNVALALFGLLMVTTGSPGLMICDQVKGPVVGVLAVPSSVTVTPANGGFGFEENVGRATDVNVPGMQVSGGTTSSGKGVSWPLF